MTQQLDMMPGALTDPAVLERIAEQMPKAREVKQSRLRGYEPNVVVPDDIQSEFERDAAALIARTLVRTFVRSQLDKLLRVEEQARFDVGYELVLPERAREDHR